VGLLFHFHLFGAALNACFQGALCLFVLSVNPAAAPGELPVWGAWTVFTETLARAVVANAQAGRGRPDVAAPGQAVVTRSPRGPFPDEDSRWRPT
jgi:hypothetical protein